MQQGAASGRQWLAQRIQQDEDAADAADAQWNQEVTVDCEPHGCHAHPHSPSTRRELDTLRSELKKMQGHFKGLCKEAFRGLEALEVMDKQTQNVSVGSEAAPTQQGKTAATAQAEVEKNDDVFARLAALESAVSELRSAQSNLPPLDSVDGVGPMDMEPQASLASESQRDAPPGSAPQVEAPPPEPEERVDDVNVVGETNVDGVELDYICDAYSFQESVWDAFVLLLCTNSDGKPFLFKWDVGLLVIAFVFNLFAQFLFLIIVEFDMLNDVDFSDTTVNDLLSWRAAHGHVLTPDGFPYIEQICSRSYSSYKDWSYVKDAVETWQTYIAWEGADEFLIPGRYLSVMSLLLWTMSCLAEYRAVVEQAMGIWLLPSPDEGSPWRFDYGRIKHTIEDGAISSEIICMPYPTKILILVVMSMFRLALVMSLCIMGIQFVAQTSSLVDLILNAIALAFVLDIDNFLATILLTRHVRESCTEMKPLTCGPTMRGCWAGCTKRDILKMVVWITFLGLGLFVWLDPYWASAKASVDALCLGNTNFIVKGANATVATTIIVDMQDALRPDVDPYLDAGHTYYQTCEAALAASYREANYPDLLWYPMGDGNRMTVPEIEARMKAITLDYAFLTVPTPFENEKLQPPLEQKAFAAGERVYRVWSDEWSAADMQPCPRFDTNYHKRWQACVPFPALETIPNCSWTRGADLCEGEPPGEIYRMACSLSSQTAKVRSCYAWSAFRVENPFLNCPTVVNGTSVQLGASLSLEVAHLEYFRDEVQQNSTIHDAVVQTLVDALASLHEDVAAPDSSPIDTRSTFFLDMGGVPRRLQVAGGGEGSAAEGRADDTNDTNDAIDMKGQIDIPFSVRRAPDTLTTDYFNQVNWRQVAENLSSVLTAFDPRLRVHGFLSQSSAVNTAYCSSYPLCGESYPEKRLKVNATDIIGWSDEECCAETCWYWKEVGEDINAACDALAIPSEILRSEDALRATVVNDPQTKYFQLCCEEQLKCDLWDDGMCADLTSYEGSVVRNDAHNIYQGVQDDLNFGYPCCSFTCQSASDSSVAVCDASAGLTLVANASYVYPHVESLVWVGLRLEIVDFERDCCEPTTVLCTTWNDDNADACEVHGGVVLPNADEIYGEHHELCCGWACGAAWWDELEMECGNYMSLHESDEEKVTTEEEWKSDCCTDT